MFVCGACCACCIFRPLNASATYMLQWQGFQALLRPGRWGVHSPGIAAKPMLKAWNVGNAMCMHSFCARAQRTKQPHCITYCSNVQSTAVQKQRGHLRLAGTAGPSNLGVTNSGAIHICALNLIRDLVVELAGVEDLRDLVGDLVVDSPESKICASI